MPRKIRIVGEDAYVRTLGKKETRHIFGAQFRPKFVLKKNKKKKYFLAKKTTQIVERTAHSLSNQPAAYSTALVLARLFFPRNFPKMIATGTREYAKHSAVTYTKQVPLTLKSNNAIHSFYTNSSRPNPTHMNNLNSQTELEQKASLMRTRGIYPNDNPVNVGLQQRGTNKDFIFFEIYKIHVPTLGKAVQNLPENTPSQRLRKKQAQELLDFIKKQPQNKDGFVKTHYND